MASTRGNRKVNHDTETAMIHEGCLYGSDEELLTTALPFIREGVETGEPVLVTAASGTLDLLADALGEGVEYTESGHFGRRPVQRISGLYGFWRKHADGGHRHVRIFAEPIWSGRSGREIAEWTRMESMLNVVLASTRIWMICPYDLRMLDADIIADAQRTHPLLVRGRRRYASSNFVDPIEFVKTRGTRLESPPPYAMELCFDGDLHGLRTKIAQGEVARELPEDQRFSLITAVNEVVIYLAGLGEGPIRVRLWRRLGAIVCDVDNPTAHGVDPTHGVLPPDFTDTPDPVKGLFLARRISRHLEIHPTETGCRVVIEVAGGEPDEPPPLMG